MIHIETKHYTNTGHKNGVEKTEKIWRFFGIVIKRKVYNYPNLSEYEIRDV